MTIQLTFTQCKQLLNNGVDLREFIESIEQQPDFIKHMGEIDSISEMQAIIQGGCASGAYMPAVTYAVALECFTEHSNEITDLLEEFGYEDFTFCLKTETLSSFASSMVSAAVECWVNQFQDMLDGVNWD